MEERNNKSAASGGIGFTGLLTLVFIVLKLCGVITWSWWWVLSPMWISVGLGVLAVIVVWGAYGIMYLINNKKKKLK